MALQTVSILIRFFVVTIAVLSLQFTACQNSNRPASDSQESSPDYETLIEHNVAGEFASRNWKWPNAEAYLSIEQRRYINSRKAVDRLDEQQVQEYRTVLIERLTDLSSAIRLHAVSQLVGYSAAQSPESATEFEVATCLPVYLELLEGPQPMMHYDRPADITQARTLVFLTTNFKSTEALSFASRLGSRGEPLVEPIASLLSKPHTVYSAVKALSQLGPVATPALDRIKEAIENTPDAEKKIHLQELVDGFEWIKAASLETN